MSFVKVTISLPKNLHEYAKELVQKGLFSKEKLVECKIENLKQKAIVKEMTMQILK